MKKTITFIMLLLIAIAAKAQNYQISFTGSGESSVVDSIYVENLTQGTELGLAGSETLNLVGTLSVDSHFADVKDIKIYPNPMQEKSRIAFYNDQADIVKLEVFNLVGKLISSKTEKANLGINTFEINGLPAGVYIVKLSTNSWQSSSKLISEGVAMNSQTIISRVETPQTYQNKSTLNSSQSIIQMQYNDGDLLLIEGLSGDNVSNITMVPTQSQTLNLEFFGCADADGNNYATVTIGNQVWMSENLNYETGNSWCYDADDANCDLYGRLYDWQTALTVCPSGWHLPSDAEWTELIDYLGGPSVAGGKMKSVTGWYPPNVEATNSSGFSGLPGGAVITNYYFDVDYYTYWWSSTEYNADRAWHRYIYFGNDDSTKHHGNKNYGYSCRCIKD
ncbi:FISUMP domain-containing protein [Psychroflexus planctonicus]|uniref:Por secretion system C-terminal sorting domain-containing protein n=1 Tax=Psychroflexus planctonicus TaxID=1526575 RepID=A0ABQ1SG95_9FLAO|nr:FISUMP domain-containing protein [Psychroflexus planctonicus]GGE31766.1 hypothetical protein GCM10010832_10110 [Psychroflexus planctonicus]